MSATEEARARVVVVSQRVDVAAGRDERRDALDQRLCQWLATAACVAMPVPNALCASSWTDRGEGAPGLQAWLSAAKPEGIVLSGGNDIGEAPERDATERHLLGYARDLGLPALGICRGMQMMAIWAGGDLVRVDGHVRTRHALESDERWGDWPAEVNSFHAVSLNGCPPGFAIAARAGDGTIEAIRHAYLPWEGWMWHPERERVPNPRDLMRFRALLDSRASR